MLDSSNDGHGSNSRVTPALSGSMGSTYMRPSLTMLSENQPLGDSLPHRRSKQSLSFEAAVNAFELDGSSAPSPGCSHRRESYTEGYNLNETPPHSVSTLTKAASLRNHNADHQAQEYSQLSMGDDEAVGAYCYYSVTILPIVLP